MLNISMIPNFNTFKEQNKFEEYYRCTIEMSNRVSYNRMIGVVQIGAQPTLEEIQTTEEPVVAIYLPESMANQLIEDVSDRINQAELRSVDDRLMELYSAYMTLYNLLK